MSNESLITNTLATLTDDELEQAIAQARQLLGKVEYQAESEAYYVVRNNRDLGEEEFCSECIKEAVRARRKEHKERRQEIIASHQTMLDRGYVMLGKDKILVTRAQIVSSKRSALREFPAKASFSYEGHDPDFGGGLRHPKSCEDCGRYFDVFFNPDKEEAEYLLTLVNNPEPLQPSEIWELDRALDCEPGYWKADVKPVMLEVIQKLTGRLSSTTAVQEVA